MRSAQRAERHAAKLASDKLLIGARLAPRTTNAPGVPYHRTGVAGVGVWGFVPGALCDDTLPRSADLDRCVSVHRAVWHAQEPSWL